VRDRLRGALVLHFAAGEECGEPGTLSLLNSGFTGDWGVTTEPTDFALATAMRGVAWYRIKLDGRSTHAATRYAGCNPIPAARQVLAALERYDQEISVRCHPLVGEAACTPTMLAAGAEHNAVPDSCEITVDRRLVPGETPQAVLHDLSELVTAALVDDNVVGSVSQIRNAFAPAEVASSSAFINALSDAITEVTQKPPRLEGTRYGSDVRNLVNDAGMEAVTFGAGDVSQCHCSDEHQPIGDVGTAALVLTKLATELLA
jgi:succinyl-diaminopimelate desuccinylase